MCHSLSTAAIAPVDFEKVRLLCPHIPPAFDGNPTSSSSDISPAPQRYLTPDQLFKVVPGSEDGSVTSAERSASQTVPQQPLAQETTSQGSSSDESLDFGGVCVPRKSVSTSQLSYCAKYLTEHIGQEQGVWMFSQAFSSLKEADNRAKQAASSETLTLQKENPQLVGLSLFP